MNKILTGLLITGAAVAVGVVVAKVIKSKNSAIDYDDDDMYDYPDPYDTDEDINFALSDELDEADKAAAEAAEETADVVVDDTEADIPDDEIPDDEE